ncbi:Parvovirus coat protein VP1-like protein [Aquibacillus halophilus]|uniref:Parvovirus coat protein VP1-like protein n=1 Tax=Aquibacillus halophilus TaxID=930132 RepID=A0A6A8DLQ6_9BACI|nr:Parvovirus coat protein VP1-like protein [Aquibacillus halophilus]MRH43927.1 Parvovirus coat protein VP1-like protein [Aquibacillus halophilus]
MPCFNGYRYCGPNCSGPGAPINQLDAICRQHDACYRKFGHYYCDQVFLNQVRPYINQRSQIGRDARTMYRAINLKRSF